MRFEKGDLVKVKERLSVGTTYGGLGFIPEMREYKGKTLVIEDVCSGYYLVEGNTFCWTDEMLLQKKVKNSTIENYDVVKISETYDHDRFKENIAVRYKNNVDGYIIFLDKCCFHDGDGHFGNVGCCYYIDDKYLIKQKLEKVKINKENLEKDIKKYKKLLKDSEQTGVYVLLENTKEEPTSDEFEIVKLTSVGLYLVKQEEKFFLVKEEFINHEKKESENIKKLTESITKLTKKIEEREPFEKAMTEAIIEKGKDIATKDLEERIKNNLDDFIKKTYGILPKVIELKSETKIKKTTGIFHKDFEKICKLVDKDIPVMLVGGAGAGKNYTLEQVAKALDLEFYTTNAINQEYKLTGFIDANGKYHETEFYKAFTKGGIFFLDEIDASCPEAIIILNGAIANKYFDFPTGRVIAHKDFRVVCAGNTYGTGADMMYVGRNVLDGATLDRFIVLNFDYDENVELQLAYDEELFNFIKELRDVINKSGIRHIVSMRAIINSTKMLELGFDKEEILRDVIIKNMQIDDINIIAGKLSSSDWTTALKKMSDIK